MGKGMGSRVRHEFQGEISRVLAVDQGLGSHVFERSTVLVQGVSTFCGICQYGECHSWKKTTTEKTKQKNKKTKKNKKKNNKNAEEENEI